MNRNFFSEDDKECKERCYEVEMLRAAFKAKFPPKLFNRLKMFLDVHAHSTQPSIFIYAPKPETEPEEAYIKRFPKILHNTSPYFQFDNCKFSNDKYKKNCARLSLNREFQLLDSYTIESSVFGYEVKGSGTENLDPIIE